jgi:hypothetical protein
VTVPEDIEGDDTPEQPKNFYSKSKLSSFNQGYSVKSQVRNVQAEYQRMQEEYKAQQYKLNAIRRNSKQLQDELLFLRK